MHQLCPSKVDLLPAMIILGFEENQTTDSLFVR